MWKVLLLLASLGQSGETRTLQYTTDITAEGSFTIVTLDEEELFYYNGSEVIFKAEWMKTIKVPKDYWTSEKDRMWRHDEDLKSLDQTVYIKKNKVESEHRVRCMYGCAFDDDNTSTGHFSCRADDYLIHLDLKNATWTVAGPRNDTIKMNRVSDARSAQSWKYYLETKCVQQLKLILHFSRDAAQRKANHSNVTEVIPTTETKMTKGANETEGGENPGGPDKVGWAVIIVFVVVLVVVLVVVVHCCVNKKVGEKLKKQLETII